MRKHGKTKEQPIRQQGKKIPWLRWVTVLVAIIFFLAATALWILNAEHLVQGDWSSILPIIFTVLSIIFALCQWLVPFSSEDTTPPAPTFEKATSQMLLDQAKAHYKAKRYAQAVSAYQEVLELDRNCVEAYGGLALVFLKSRSVEKAFAAFEIAERLQSRYHERETTVPDALSTQKIYNMRTSVIVESAGSSHADSKPHGDHENSFFGVQDTLSTGETFGLFGVVDGTPTMDPRQEASSLAIQAIINYVLSKLRGMTMKDLESGIQKTILAESIQQANRVVFQHREELHTDIKTIVTVALMIGTTVYIAHVGSSRAYLYRKEVGLIKITQDHSVVADLAERSIITRDDIYDHSERKQIYHSLGEQPSIEVDLYTKVLEPNDRLLLCSHSLWHKLGDSAIQRIMSESISPPSESVEALIRAASNGEGEDTISAVILHIVEVSSQ